MAATNSDDLIALLRSEKENLELVNSNLLGVLEKKETEINDLHNELVAVEEELAEKGNSVDKAHAIIRKLNDDYEKSIRDIQRLETVSDRATGEKKELEKQMRQAKMEMSKSEDAKKLEERLRGENQRCKEEMLELARVTRDDKERSDREREKTFRENEEYKYIVSQLEGKLGEIEKVVNERNLMVQQQDAIIVKFKSEAEIREKELAEQRKRVEEILTDKDLEIENVKKMASSSMRSFYANVSQSTDPGSPAKEADLSISCSRTAARTQKPATKTQMKAPAEQNTTGLVKPWMEVITAECMKQIEDDLEQRAAILGVLEEHRGAVGDQRLDAKRMSEKVAEYHEGIRMRIEDLETQLVEVIRKNKMFSKITKGYELTVEALEKQLAQEREVGEKHRALLNSQNQELLGHIATINSQRTEEFAENARATESAIGKIAEGKRTEDNEREELAVLKERLEDELHALSLRFKDVSDQLMTAQGELSLMEQIVLSDEKVTAEDSAGSKRVAEVAAAMCRLRAELDRGAEVKLAHESALKRISAMLKENAELAAELRKGRDQLAETQKMLESVQAQMRSKTQELRGRTDELNAKSEECIRIRKELELEKDASRRKETNYQELKSKSESEAAQKTSAIQQMQQELAKMQSLRVASDESSRNVSHELSQTCKAKEEYRERCEAAEQHIQELEERLRATEDEYTQCKERAEMADKMYRDEYEQYARANVELKGENDSLHVKTQELTISLQEAMNDAQLLRIQIEKLRASAQGEEQNRPMNEGGYTSEKFSSSRITFGEERRSTASVTKVEELEAIREKASKLAPSARLEYYESVIEALERKRLRTKKSFEKRILEFEQILRLIEAAIQTAAMGEKADAQTRTKVLQMESQVFGLIKNNASLTAFLKDLLSAIDMLSAGRGAEVRGE